MTLVFDNSIAKLYQGDARALPVADRSVHCCVTSPPYWGLRDYGLADWEGGDAKCSHVKPMPDWVQTHLDKAGTRPFRKPEYFAHSEEPWPNGVCGHCGARQQGAGIGLEPTLSEWLDNIVAVGREVWRVLRDDGTWWLNLGDAYAGSGKGPATSDKQASNQGSVRTSFRRDRAEIIPGKRTPRGEGSGRWGMGDVAVDGLPAKNLMGQPWRAAFALQDDGWILRKGIIWHKPNPMPESVSDRPTSAHEMIFLLVKQPRYFYDAEAVRQPSLDPTDNRAARSTVSQKRMPSEKVNGIRPNDKTYPTANLRDVWTIPTQGRPDAHFASFPDEVPKRCILAGTSEHGVCADCGAPWVRQVEKELQTGNRKPNQTTRVKDADPNDMGAARDRAGHIGGGSYYETQTVGWQPTCDCGAATVPATVLDPFIGRGTTAIVAQRLGRRAIGVDLNPDYLALARKNLEATNLPLLVHD